MSTHKKVIYISRADAEQLVPPPRSHLISISDGSDEQAVIDKTRWDSTRFCHFVDGGFDESIVNACGPDFLRIYASYLLPESAEELREHIKGIAEAADMIVVNCRYGRSRSAAVARFISETHGFKLDRQAPEANMTVYRLLMRDPFLLEACRRASCESRQVSDTEPHLLDRLCRWLGLAGSRA